MNELTRYVEQHTSPEPEYLYRLWRASNLHLLNGRMVSGHVQGRLLKTIVQMLRPHLVLEVGTFSGYSAICLAEGLEDGGHVYTFEVDDELEPFTRPWIEQSPEAGKITLIIGDAIEKAPQLGLTFDLVFLDGDKRQYVEAYEMALSVLRPGGFILADNTLWDGHVCDPAYDRDRQTQGIRKFNDYIANDSRTEQVMLPLRDGLTIIHKL